MTRFEIIKRWFAIFALIFLSCVAVWVVYNKITLKGTIEQEVTRMSDKEKYGHWETWERSKAITSMTYSPTGFINNTEINPYATKETLYVLVTSVNDHKTVDTGTEKEITALKCSRYAEMIQLRKIDSLNEVNKRKEYKHSEEVLERLNNTNCK